MSIICLQAALDRVTAERDTARRQVSELTNRVTELELKGMELNTQLHAAVQARITWQTRAEATNLGEGDRRVLEPKQPPGDIIGTAYADAITALRAQNAALQAQVGQMRKVTNQCRLAFGGYVDARTAVDMLDALGPEASDAIPQPEPRDEIAEAARVLRGFPGRAWKILVTPAP